MILGLGSILIVFGMIFLGTDVFIPLSLELMPLFFTLKIIGIMFIPLGLLVIVGRAKQTGVDVFLDLPNSKRTICIHSRRGKNPNASIISGKLTDLEFIRSKNKLFKDTGGGFRLAGHDVRRTHETICHDIPEWLGQYFHLIRKKYGVSNIDDLKSLYDSLKKLDGNEDAIKQLEGIKLLNPILQDEKKKQDLLNMRLSDFHHMSEMIWDGTTIHMEDVEEFIESATPNELDALEKQEFLNEMMREKNYSEPGSFNFAKWFPYITTLILVCAVAVVMVLGVFGN